MNRTRRFRLRGVHFLYDPQYSEPKHGHEYRLEVTVDAKIPDEIVRATVDRLILKGWDQKDWSKSGLLQASGELLVEKFDSILRSSEIGAYLVSVELQETFKNRFISSSSKIA